MTTKNSTMMRSAYTEIVTFSREVRSDVKLKFGFALFKISFCTCHYVFNRSVTGGSGAWVGGLVGYQGARGTDVIASYAGGRDYSKLVGRIGNRVTNSYHQLTSGGTEDATSKLEATLVTPIGYTGIYMNWNLDLNSDNTNDDPWDFGTNAQYPVLNGIDANGDGTINAADLAEQRK